MPTLESITLLLGFDPLLILPVFFVLTILYSLLKERIEDKINELLAVSSCLLAYLILYLQNVDKFDYSKNVISAIVLGGISLVVFQVVGPIMKPIIEACRLFIIRKFEQKTGVDVDEEDLVGDKDAK